MKRAPYYTLALITPVLDDWESFTHLIAEIDRIYSAADVSLHVLAIDDGSTTALDAAQLIVGEDSCIVGINIVHLGLNVGHQRAIAVGLAKILDRKDIEGVIIMDSDGEDRPGDIHALLQAARSHPEHAIMARRVKRLESWTFRAFYAAYKALFRILSGHAISFGNFSFIPMNGVRRLTYMSELWNNLPASIMRSRLPLLTIPTERGRRYAGSSKMNLTALILHGMSTMSVFTEVIFIRLLLLSSVIVGLTLLGIAAATVIRLETSLAIPGWTSTVVAALSMILLQTVGMVGVMTLVLLSGRRARPMIPAVECLQLIASVETVMPERVAPREDRQPLSVA